MKKKIWLIPVIIVLLIAIVLLLPVPQGSYDDGGTRDYNALTYKIVRWNKIIIEQDENGHPIHDTYCKTSVFWYPDNLKSIDELWEMERANAKSDTKNYKLPWDQFCYSETDSQAVEIPNDGKQYIINLLNNATWINDLGKCESDYVFYTQKQELRYHSECGTFNDVTNKKSTTLSEEQRVAVNAHLGLTSTENAFDFDVSYANHNDSQFLGGLNADKMSISSVRHLPIYKFDTLSELEQFKKSADGFTYDKGYDEVPSFNDAVAKYDESFFAENSLMLVYVAANNSTHRYGVNSVFCDGTAFYIHVEQTNNPESVDTAMSGWFITVAVPDSMIRNCTEFDAALNNYE